MSRDYKEFGNAKFRGDVKNFAFDQFDVSNVKETIFNIFDKHAPIKQKYLPANKPPFMTKELHRQIIKGPRLRDDFLKTKSQEDILEYKKQRNFCKNLLRAAKKGIKKLLIIEVSGRVPPFFSTKFSKGDKFILNENDKHV